MSKREKKLDVNAWLKASPDSKLADFGKLPNHAMISFILQFLNIKELGLNSRISRSFKELIANFNETAHGQKNLSQYLTLKLRRIAKEQKIVLSATTSFNHVITNLDSSLEAKRISITSTTRTQKASVYETVCCCLLLTALAAIGGGNGGDLNFSGDTHCGGTMPRWGVNLLRILFVFMCAGSAYELDNSIRNGYGIEVDAGWGGLVTLTGATLLWDIGQSISTRCQERRIIEIKTQVASLHRTHQLIYNQPINHDAKEQPSSTPYVRLTDDSDDDSPTP